VRSLYSSLVELSTTCMPIEGIDFCSFSNLRKSERRKSEVKPGLSISREAKVDASVDSLSCDPDDDF